MYQSTFGSTEFTEKRRIENARTPINRRMKKARTFPKAKRRLEDGGDCLIMASTGTAINGRRNPDVRGFVRALQISSQSSLYKVKTLLQGD